MHEPKVADVLLVLLMAGSSVLKMYRSSHLCRGEQISAVTDLSGVSVFALLQNLLSLLGTLLSDKLRHSQGIFSLAQCTADCVFLAAQCPNQRLAILTTYTSVFIASSTAYSLSLFHLVGWICAWAMAAVSSGLIIHSVTSTVPVSDVFPCQPSRPHVGLLLCERSAAFAAYVIYAIMLLADEPSAGPGIGFLQSIPMFWPWLLNALANLVDDGKVISIALLHTKASSSSYSPRSSV